MEKTGKQIEENELNAVNGGNLYIVNNSGMCSLYDSNGELIGTFYANAVEEIYKKAVNATAEQIGKSGTTYNATEKQMKELRETGKTTINGVEFHSGD